LAATSQFNVGVPIVIGLTGTNEQEAFRILEGVGMTSMYDMDAAVKKAVELAKGAA
jgi:succinyl-CoA synthetase beta subunit